MSPDDGGWGGGGVAGSQPMSTAVHMDPKILWRSNSMFNLLYVQRRPSFAVMGFLGSYINKMFSNFKD